MNKAYLVALREYVENLRTKAFWIGILAFPVILIAVIVVSRLLNDAKDVRTYTVVDHSEGQWLSQAVFEEVRKDDIGELMREAEANRGEPSAEEVRAGIEKQMEELEAGHPLRDMFEILLQANDDELEAMGRGEAPSMKLMLQMTPLMMEWSKDPDIQKQMLSFAGDLSMGEYEYVEFDDLGENPESTLNKKLTDEELFAYFVIGDDPEADNEGNRYVSNNVTDNDLKNWFSRKATAIVQKRRADKLKETKGLTDEEAKLLSASVRFDEAKVDEETGETEDVSKADEISGFAPIAFVYLLFIAIMTATQMLLTNTIEEKSNRIIEVLLSSVSPLQLMAGKILGIGATGLTVLGSWVICGLVAVKLIPVFMSNAPSDFDLTEILGDPLYIASFVGYFIGGYFFYAALFVGVGSVCNSLKEAQNLQQPIIIALIIPLLAMVPVSNDPNGTLAIVLTYIPPFTPFLMMNRAAAPPALWEYFASTAVIIVSTALAFWGAAKVFRIGILMTGKPPKIREILGWMRAPVGTVPVVREKTD